VTKLQESVMALVEMYTTPICPFCVRAKALLKRKGVTWTEIDVASDEAVRDAMVERAGGKRSVPQIFIDGVHVGGSDDLHALDKDGKLDAMLGLAG
jgi:glutaredoxin 3